MSITVDLVNPITIDGEETYTIEFREPTVKDWMKWEAAQSQKTRTFDPVTANLISETGNPDDIASNRAMVLACSSLTPKEIDEMKLYDLTICAQKLTSFLGLPVKPKKK